MNAATAGSAGNYRMTATSTKHAKKKTIPPPTPVAFTARYNAATNSVTLTLAGKQAFAKGGQIAVIYGAVTSASGDGLGSSDATFTIDAEGEHRTGTDRIEKSHFQSDMMVDEAYRVKLKSAVTTILVRVSTDDDAG